MVAARLGELAFLHRGLHVSLPTKARAKHPGPSGSGFRAGARDFVTFLDAPAGEPVRPDVIGLEREAPPWRGQ